MIVYHYNNHYKIIIIINKYIYISSICINKAFSCGAANARGKPLVYMVARGGGGGGLNLITEVAN